MAENPTCPVEEFTRTIFDYVICGGGTAGLVLAARLSENPDITVGVIEAGKYRIGDPLVDTPATFSQMFENPEYDWCMYTTPQVGLFCIFTASICFQCANCPGDIGRQPWPVPPYPTRKAPRWIQRHQLYDVRARIDARLRRLGGDSRGRWLVRKVYAAIYAKASGRISAFPFPIWFLSRHQTNKMNRPSSQSTNPSPIALQCH
jgi:hypothetical protein